MDASQDKSEPKAASSTAKKARGGRQGRRKKNMEAAESDSEKATVRPDEETISTEAHSSPPVPSVEPLVQVSAETSELSHTDSPLALTQRVILERLEYGKVCESADGPILKGGECRVLACSSNFIQHVRTLCNPHRMGLGDLESRAMAPFPHGTVIRPHIVQHSSYHLCYRLRRRPEDGEGGGSRAYWQGRYLLTPPFDGTDGIDIVSSPGSLSPHYPSPPLCPHQLFRALDEEPMRGLLVHETTVLPMEVPVEKPQYVEPVSSALAQALDKMVELIQDDIPVGVDIDRDNPIGESDFFRLATLIWDRLSPNQRRNFSCGWGVGQQLTGQLSLSASSTYQSGVEVFTWHEERWQHLPVQRHTTDIQQRQAFDRLEHPSDLKLRANSEHFPLAPRQAMPMRGNVGQPPLLDHRHRTPTDSAHRPLQRQTSGGPQWATDSICCGTPDPIPDHFSELRRGLHHLQHSEVYNRQFSHQLICDHLVPLWHESRGSSHQLEWLLHRIEQTVLEEQLYTLVTPILVRVQVQLRRWIRVLRLMRQGHPAPLIAWSNSEKLIRLQTSNQGTSHTPVLRISYELRQLLHDLILETLPEDITLSLRNSSSQRKSGT